MKKILATAATFSLMSLSLTFLACGDDSSSSPTGEEPNSLGRELSSSSGESGKVIVASVMDACRMNGSLVGQDKAYLLGNEKNGYNLVIPDMHVDNEWHGDELPAKRNGDSLIVGNPDEILGSLNWVCYADHQFDITAADADIKYFKLYNSVFEVVPGPIPDRVRDTIIEVNSSSSIVPESSSNMPPSSSSSVTPTSSFSRPSYSGHVPLKSITATCREEVWTNDPVVDPELPAAYYSVSNSFAQIDLLKVKLTYACDSALQKAFFDNLNADNTVASVIGDTLFVNIDHSSEKGVKLECGCTADVKFTFDESYAVFGYTAFENNRPPLELGHRLINQPDLGYQKITKADAQCMGNDSPDDPMVDAALPPVAHMYVNGDSAQVVIERVMVTCASIIESVEAQVKDSVLYVTPHYDTSAPQADCICNTKVSFNVAARSPFTEATLLVYDNDPGNKMRLIVE